MKATKKTTKLVKEENTIEEYKDLVLPFGKYKGVTIEYLMKENKEYARWLYLSLCKNCFKNFKSIKEKLSKHFSQDVVTVTVYVEELVIQVGKYKGDTLKQVIKKDNNYAWWYANKVLNKKDKNYKKIYDYIIANTHEPYGRYSSYDYNDCGGYGYYDDDLADAYSMVMHDGCGGII